MGQQTFEDWEIPEDIDDEMPKWLFPRDHKNKNVKLMLSRTAQYNSSKGEPFPVLICISEDGMTKYIISLLGQQELMKQIRAIQIEKKSIDGVAVTLSADKEGKKWKVI